MTSKHPAMHPIASRDNPLLKELRKLAQGNTAYRKTGRFWWRATTCASLPSCAACNQ